MGVHQYARFSNQTMLSHERALHWIVSYLSTTADRGIVYDIDPSLGILYFGGADFVESWSKADADNPENVMLHTVEAEYTALLSAMCK
eukprot:11864579-Ditylum_brightwellii.AAC.1